MSGLSLQMMSLLFYNIICANSIFFYNSTRSFTLDQRGNGKSRGRSSCDTINCTNNKVISQALNIQDVDMAAVSSLMQNIELLDGLMILVDDIHGKLT